MMGTEQVIARGAELLWIGGLAATPMAAAVAVLCRYRGVRPATRHMLLVAVLASFITPALGSLVWRPHWFRSDRLIAAADSVLAQPGSPSTLKSKEVPQPAPRPMVKSPPSSTPVLPAPAGTLPWLATLRHANTEFAGDPAAAGPVRETSVSRETPFVGGVSRAQDYSSDLTASPFSGNVPLESPAPSDVFVGPALLPSPSRVLVASPTPMPARTSSVPPETTASSAADQMVRAEHPARAPSSGRLSVRAWLVRVLSARDALADLPPVPLSLWFGGAVFIVMLSLWRRCLGALWLRKATPAGPHVQAVVRQVGETLGLARTPRVVFVEASVSPMIWCGLRPLLVLPTSLWRTLDEDSRRAVLVHELAHVRRWDHVLCWLEAAVGAVYWWHPVVWWARRRLHEEAEASCDAWVTALFPSARRAYASALVVTKSYVSSRAQTRGPWLGVASGSAKRLARRITMVMTHKAAPRVSTVGLFLAVLVIATGTFVMPSLACPPDDEEAKAKAQHVKVHVAPAVVSQNGVDPAAKADGAGATFFGEAPALEAMKARPQTTQPEPPTPAIAPRAPRAPKAPKPAKAPQPPIAVFTAPPAGQLAQPEPPVALDLEALKEGRTPREYQLSRGKLEAFYGMMSRGDIPILVQLQGDHIVIWGTDDEHAVFSKFVEIVDGNSKAPRGAVVINGNTLRPLAKIDAERLAEAAAAGNRSGVLGAQQAAANEYRSAMRAATRDREAAEVAAEKARAEAEEARDRAAELREHNSELAEQRQELEQAAKNLRSRSDAIQTETRTTEQRVRDLERLIRQMEERAQRLEQQLDNTQGRKTSTLKRSSSSPGMLDPRADAQDVAPGTSAGDGQDD